MRCRQVSPDSVVSACRRGRRGRRRGSDEAHRSKKSDGAEAEDWGREGKEGGGEGTDEAGEGADDDEDGADDTTTTPIVNVNRKNRYRIDKEERMMGVSLFATAEPLFLGGKDAKLMREDNWK
mmetsp:Transcript_26215/g.52267  ORF Transcript_26215/g.52267 Transcript_26215/m.52267 type:complete len:123 (-) Transcript_26215:145-513(-)|eukprot:CAMPEP_0182462272 /NCGR_PEP_ID=MMETSP1319-20130603/6597_1 /TAXON_ID=172717 /ORGANISM="Bolidomonas pacifica, Strain RCC208" /LENGTH=122 /DNA_ID=CAMNT_0024661685 /DNA_START=201 /DNA_END=569 /DNA_ORIENTATION=-